jgi:tetratricopeptide (TPR) repeat protein
MRKMAGMFFAVILFAACTDPMEKEYESIKNSGLIGEALLKRLSEFELRNMGHFNSKIDLGGYYLLAGDIGSAEDYFRRAEALVQEAPTDGDTEKNITIMYGSLARLHFIGGEYDPALEYAEKAAAGDNEEALPYRYLQGHIFLEKGEIERALEIFDPLFASHPNTASPDDIRAYMYLLAAANRLREAAVMADLFFEKGRYFPGLGLFASSVYEASGQAEKAVYAAFLDSEYQCGYQEMDSSAFLKNIDTLEQELEAQEKLGPAAGALNLVRSIYDESRAPVQYEPSFFAGEYISLKKKILDAGRAAGVSLTEADFNRYLAMEHYFLLFPEYYWNLWQGAGLLNGSLRADYIPALERIIVLDREGVYAQQAWDEISKTLGFKTRGNEG